MTSQDRNLFSRRIDSIAESLIEELTLRFPVCLSSDEFHFFPQARATDPDWSRWDDFSLRSIGTIGKKLDGWNRELSSGDDSLLSPEHRIDLEMLRRMISTLHEQLTMVSAHQTQPTFYLTILGIGMAEAVDAGPRAVRARTRGLPEFICQARKNLRKIPGIFRDRGIEMIRELIPWLRSLRLPQDLLLPAIASLADLNAHLEQIPVTPEFLLPRGIYERVAQNHMGCERASDDIAGELNAELSETETLLKSAAERLFPGRSWQETVAGLPLPTPPPGGVRQIYHGVISELADHCVAAGLTTSEQVADSRVRVEEIPDYMMPVRSNAAYSMPAGHPARGGTFFIMGSGNAAPVPRDYRLLTAHETFPGHHLLDTSRWNLDRPLRRHLEFPLFYEGWASFSEEILFDTGFFGDPVDRILLAKRRFWRAMRGRVDLDIHTRRKTAKEAARFLVDHGMDRPGAAAMVKRYILKPGYQLAYTIGRRRFRRRYDQYRGKGGDPASFTRQILAQGEIGFSGLTRVLQ
jgi:hypothetical protein